MTFYAKSDSNVDQLDRTAEEGDVYELRAVSTYFLIQSEIQVDLSELVADVKRIPGMTGARRVTGPYDVIAEAAGSLLADARTATAAAVGDLEGVIRVISLPVVGPTQAETRGDPRAA